MFSRRLLEHPAQVHLPAFADPLLHGPALAAFDEVGVFA